MAKWLIDANDYAFPGDLINEPTVDAVEVCYCKDCKHMEITPEGLRWCNAWNGINGMGDDGYCNYGERRCEDG